MKLAELQLTKDFRYDKSLSDVYSDTYIKPGDFVEKILAKYGWKVLGTGVDASVAEHPNYPHVVLKLFAKESPYKTFVDIVKQNSGNPYFPHFTKGVRDIPGTNFSYILMEKLAKTDKNVLTGTYFPEMVVLFYMTEKYRLVWKTGGISTYDIMAAIDKCLSNSAHSYSDFMKNVKSRELWDCIGRIPPADWFQACEAVCATAKTHGYRIDLHANNFMIRGRRLVIIDPYDS
jgi:hypothetical protein